MSEQSYIEALLPVKVRLLGQPLHALTLGHVTLLRAFDNAFVSGTRPATIGDLLQGVFICSRTYNEAIRDLQSKWFDFRMRLWGLCCGWKLDIGEKMRVFTDYIEAGSRHPEMCDPEEGARAFGSPFIQRIRLHLISRQHVPNGEVMDFPYSLALHDFFATCEESEKVKVVNDDERKMLDDHDMLWAKFSSDEQAMRILTKTPNG